MKTGRNEPCPCGSGKKYKKCCGLKNKGFDISIPEDCVTNTPLDDYMMLLKAIMFHGQSIIKFNKEGKDLLQKSREFEERFRPGTNTGIFDSTYMGWLYLDCRFGKSGLTVAERFIKEDFYNKLEKPGRKYVEDMVNSYSAFYQVYRELDDWVEFKELGTDRICRVHKINEEFERDSKEGAIWYVRFVGIPEEGYPIGTPYIFTVRKIGELEKAIKDYKKKIGSKYKHAKTEHEYFREYCRESMPHWAEFIVRKNDISTN